MVPQRKERNYTDMEPTVNPQNKHPRPAARWLSSTRTYLRRWSGVGEDSLHHHFLQGVAYKAGSGAVSVLILWWETFR